MLSNKRELTNIIKNNSLNEIKEIFFKNKIYSEYCYLKNTLLLKKMFHLTK